MAHSRPVPRFEIKVVALVMNPLNDEFYVTKPKEEPTRYRLCLPSAVVLHGDSVRATLSRCLQEIGFTPVEFGGRQLPCAVIETVDAPTDVHTVTLCYLLKPRLTSTRRLPESVRTVGPGTLGFNRLSELDRNILDRVSPAVP